MNRLQLSIGKWLRNQNAALIIDYTSWILLIPKTRVELNLEIESDGNLIWPVANDCRVIITRMPLFVLHIPFNSEGQLYLYMSQYLK